MKSVKSQVKGEKKVKGQGEVGEQEVRAEAGQSWKCTHTQKPAGWAGEKCEVSGEKVQRG